MNGKVIEKIFSRSQGIEILGNNRISEQIFYRKQSFGATELSTGEEKH